MAVLLNGTGVIDTPIWGPVDAEKCSVFGAVLQFGGIHVDDTIHLVIEPRGIRADFVTVESIEPVRVKGSVQIWFEGGSRLGPAGTTYVTTTTREAVNPRLPVGATRPLSALVIAKGRYGDAVVVHARPRGPGYVKIDSFRAVYRAGWRRTTCVHRWIVDFTAYAPSR